MDSTTLYRIAKNVIYLAALAMLAGNLACGSAENSAQEGNGSDEGNGNDKYKEDNTKKDIPSCPPRDPPLEDPYCHNPRCPVQVKGIDPEHLPKGNCCNRVDVELSLDKEGLEDTYDLELALYYAAPINNINLQLDLLQQGIELRQEEGGELQLMRIRNVPRTELHPKDSDGNPEGVQTTIEIGPGKKNCNGTFSFYGEKAAPAPIHKGPPDSAARWIPRVSEVNYYGFEGELLFTMAEEVSAQPEIVWRPKWGEEDLLYEQPSRFLRFFLSNSVLGDHKSCYGSINGGGEWQPFNGWTVFVPVQAAKYMGIPELDPQSLCGLYSMGAGRGECDDDTPQKDWVEKPTGYCNEEGFCWIGDPSDSYYKRFWEYNYPGINGCDPAGEEYFCCDPNGSESELPSCNSFHFDQKLVVGAVEITDQPIDDPDEALSWLPNCENY